MQKASHRGRVHLAQDPVQLVLGGFYQCFTKAIVSPVLKLQLI